MKLVLVLLDSIAIAGNQSEFISGVIACAHSAGNDMR